MSTSKNCRARAVANLAAGRILASVTVPAPQKRVFRALASAEVVEWWVRPGVFDTREWVGDVRVGGRWRASGVGRGRPYELHGEFVEIDSPTKLVHSWRVSGAPGAATMVAYSLEPSENGTRITLEHSGIAARDVCENTAIGWETSFERLAEILDSRDGAALRGEGRLAETQT